MKIRVVSTFSERLRILAWNLSVSKALVKGLELFQGLPFRLHGISNYLWRHDQSSDASKPGLLPIWGLEPALKRKVVTIFEPSHRSAIRLRQSVTARMNF